MNSGVARMQFDIDEYKGDWRLVRPQPRIRFVIQGDVGAEV